MKTTTLGLVGATVSALTALITSTARVDATTLNQLNDVMQTRGYADLLEPVPNAVAMLTADDLTKSDDRANDEAA